MAKVKPPPAIDEVKVLFPEEQVGPYTLRPWTLAQFGQAVGVLVEMLQGLQPLGLTFDNVETFLVERWPELLPVALPFFPRLISLTQRLPRDEVDRLDAGTQAALGMRIILQNQAQIKNFLTLALGTPLAGASGITLH